jgi:hypothetical protein
MTDELWPDLDYDGWAATRNAFHLYSQVLGKIRLTSEPWLNHSWHVPLYLSARGLTTRLMPHPGGKGFEVEMDLLGDAVTVRTTDGGRREMALGPGSVADFHAGIMALLEEAGVPVSIYTVPSELPDPVPFEADTVRRPWDGDAARRFWRAMVSTERVFNRFRARYLGKSSPTHFFWGSFDLAVTRFSGRRAPDHPGGIPGLPDWITREAYSHEVSSVGFWPGSDDSPTPIFYSYAYPGPEGFSRGRVEPKEAFWLDELSEFVLPYDAVRKAERPEGALMSFCHTTYEAAAELGRWDRGSLEVPEGWPRVSR